MKKLNMQSLDVIASNVEKIAHLFPNCVTERLNKEGKPELAIDFEKLQAELSNDIIAEGEERYQFTWPDKRAAVRLANTPTSMTLRPCREESVDFDNTQNLYIEGDNLDVLKVLRETYLGKVKMIYIDPPYNTGHDFVYNDNFVESYEEFSKSCKVYDDEGNLQFNPKENGESNGRFHTDWLNMIYPRLKIARDLLSNEGVIFISIDDGELDNLRKACNEIFGECNYVADLCVVNNLKGRNDKKYIARANERLLMYVKSQAFEEHGLELDNKVLSDYCEKDERGAYRLLELRKRGGPDTRKDRPNMYYPFYVDVQTGEVSLEQNSKYTQIALPVKSDGEDGRWRWGKDKAAKDLNVLYGRKVGNKYNIYQKDYLESEEGARRVRPKSVLSGAAYSTDVATKEYRSLMGKVDFNNPKSSTLLSDLIIYATQPNENALVLDFFSGSSTTAQAVIQANAEEEGNRKFIMVQLPEMTDEKSEAYKAGYKNICEIGKERIRRAGKKVKAEVGLQGQNLDIGFRVLKLDTSNMADVYYTPQESGQKTLFDENVKPDRSNEDLLFQVMLDLGIELSAKIEARQIAGKTVHFVDDNYLVACLDSNVNESTINEIAKLQPVYFVMRDSSAANDNVIDNFEQIFKHYSPDTNCSIL